MLEFLGVLFIIFVIIGALNRAGAKSDARRDMFVIQLLNKASNAKSIEEHDYLIDLANKINHMPLDKWIEFESKLKSQY